MPAFLITQCEFYDVLEIGDGRIVQASQEAASIYGYDRACDLTDRFASDIQTEASKCAGNARWVLRKHGFSIPHDYCTIVRRPDGEIIGVKGELVDTMLSRHGECYLTIIEEVKQLDEPKAIDLNEYGITPEQALEYNGKYTVAQFRKLIKTMNGDKITSIIDECERLSTEFFGWNPGSGLDFALRGDLCTWSTASETKTQTQTQTLVRLAATCDRCGWRWWRKPEMEYQCYRCKRHYTWVVPGI